MSLKTHLLAMGGVLLLAANAPAQHLWWNLEKAKDATCLYGEITVLATHNGIEEPPARPEGEGTVTRA